MNHAIDKRDKELLSHGYWWWLWNSNRMAIVWIGLVILTFFIFGVGASGFTGTLVLLISYFIYLYMKHDLRRKYK